MRATYELRRDIVGARVAGSILATRLGQLGEGRFSKWYSFHLFFRAPALRTRLGAGRRCPSGHGPREREDLSPHQHVCRRLSPYDPRRPRTARAGLIVSTSQTPAGDTNEWHLHILWKSVTLWGD